MLSNEPHGDIDRAAKTLIEIVPRLRRVIAIEAKNATSEESLTVPQWRALRLVSGGVRHPSDLARHLQTNPATASELVEGLVRRGLITRGEQGNDRRCTPLIITDAGQRAYEASLQRALASLRDLLSQLTPAEVDAINLGLTALMNLTLNPRGPERTLDAAQ